MPYWLVLLVIVTSSPVVAAGVLGQAAELSVL
jgi:hypothetical protein